jgi:hypothetical protein
MVGRDVEVRIILHWSAQLRSSKKSGTVDIEWDISDSDGK